ncbi:MAG: hypothetical protein WD534_05130 [Phycisphaeraceae bacterium]
MSGLFTCFAMILMPGRSTALPARRVTLAQAALMAAVPLERLLAALDTAVGSPPTGALPSCLGDCHPSPCAAGHEPVDATAQASSLGGHA